MASSKNQKASPGKITLGMMRGEFKYNIFLSKK